MGLGTRQSQRDPAGTWLLVGCPQLGEPEPCPPERIENVGEKPSEGQALKETWARDKVLWTL